RKRRGRPPKGQVTPNPPPPPKRAKVEDEEEDVCFVCFDGGSLVLCDRKGCPKAYHPACVKRDEAFFKSKAKWNCGWHICSVCRKASYYSCYTCPYSLCKGCTKDADYLSVRGSKGFCSTCMKTIMLIENKDQANDHSIQVDFDDQTSWEYLFKTYWVCLKEKISLTFSELKHAKKPLNPAAALNKAGLDFNHGEKFVGFDAPKPVHELERNGKKVTVENSEVAEKSCICENAVDKKPAELRSCDTAEWASKELLEFVGCMKNGNTSALSQFDVQTLVLEYIKQNNLRDPQRKSQIICDSRLRTLFGKTRVGHIEMLKLLEYHVLVKEESPKNSFVPAGFVSSGSSDVEVDNPQIPVNGRKRKLQRKGEEWSQKTNSNDYAAIDVHNIGLIYLRRNVVENLAADQENFDAKVIGSIVRIRVASSDQKQDIYRLVQVVGTTKVSEPYKVGDRSVNITLEVLNLDKKEPISIDAISNQDFTEEECKRLRQSIRCGLVKQFPVGELQKKAVSLQAIRVNDWLETEIQRLNHLRDRASENGQKLQVLSSPEERQRRIAEVPEVHVDHRMSPDYVSEEDAKSGLPSNKCNLVPAIFVSPNEPDEEVSWHHPGKEEQQSKQDQNRRKANHFAVPKPSVSGEDAAAAGGASDHIETERLWHYRDPNGKIQGPFSMMQLRRWSITGLFPPDMRIWTNHEQYDSLLLSDALNGQFHGAAEENGGESVKGEGAAELSSSWPQCWDLLKDSGVVPSSAGPEEARAEAASDEKVSEKMPEPSNLESGSVFEQTEKASFLELLSPTPRSVEDSEAKTPAAIDLPAPPSWSSASNLVLGGVQIPAEAEEWCGYSPTPAAGKQSGTAEWDSSLVVSPASSSKQPPPPPEPPAAAHQQHNVPSWLAALHDEPIEFDVLGEESVSDLLAEVDAMESQGALSSPNSALKFARELLEDCRDDCFSSIEDFGSSRGLRSDALSSTGEMHHHQH
ncbi:hypothetical protein M569_01640, partial [Genlisea aurea]